MKREIHAPTGTQLTCKNWLIEAPYRMLQNNLDPNVAFDPDNLIVYGGRGKAARNWVAFDAILASLRNLEPDETLLVQSGKPRFASSSPNLPFEASVKARWGTSGRGSSTHVAAFSVTPNGRRTTSKCPS